MMSPLRSDKRALQLRRLTEVSRALTYAVSLDQVLSLTVERAADLLDSDKAVLMLTNDDGLLAVRAQFGLEPGTWEHFREPLQETMLTRLKGLVGDEANEHFLAVPLVVAGEVTGILAVARPLTKEEVDEEEWLLSALADQAAVALEKTRLDQTAEFRERLIGIVSHDLRNPIAAIAMSAGALLRREGLDERTMKSVVRIQSAAERANRMVRDLLDYTQARIGRGLRVERAPVDLHAVVRQVVDELEAAHPERRFLVEHTGDASGLWDHDRLAQVVGNLLANAVQYSPAGTPIRVTTRGETSQATLTINNEGAPIPARVLPRLFEPMQRASADLNPANRSVGLGLYIVKHVVEAHVGTITVHSSEEAGTTFTVTLPRDPSVPNTQR